MATAAQISVISEDDYLAGEKISDIKYEYIDGYVYAMAGASNNHNLITMNVSVAFANHLKKSPCRPYASDMKVKIGSKYFYPDVIVDCSNLRVIVIIRNSQPFLLKCCLNRLAVPMKPSNVWLICKSPACKNMC